MPQVDNITFWQTQLGMLPIPLRDFLSPEFVLLNGNHGNFCLSLGPSSFPEDKRSTAWSADVGHFVTTAGKHVYTQRWDSAVQRRFEADEVLRQPERFYRLMLQEQPRRELSVIGHFMRTFRSMRTSLAGMVDGTQALQAFLCLISASSDQVDRSALDLSKWGLGGAALEIASLVGDSIWSSLREDLTSRIPAYDLTVDPTITLTHASGQLFQEAHYQAVFFSEQQMMLDGFSPAPAVISNIPQGKGVHFTPGSLARTIVEEALQLHYRHAPQSNVLTIFDPACGSGEFLRESLRQLRLKQFSGEVRIIGWDISEAACATARFSLTWEARNINATIVLKVCDSLREPSWPQDVDVLLMNPPFISWNDMTPDDRELTQQTLGSLAHLRPDLASAFLLRAAELLKTNAVMGAIIPASILDGDSARLLRSRISEWMRPHIVARLGDQSLFLNAMVDAAFYVGTKGGQFEQAPIAFWADHRSASSSLGLRTLRMLRNRLTSSLLPIERDGFSIYNSSEIATSSERWAPRKFSSWQLLERTRRFRRVSDVFNVRQGVLTGKNSVFIVSEEEWKDLPRQEKKYFRPAVVNASIRSNLLKNDSYVFYPHGKLTIDTEEQLRSALPVYSGRLLDESLILKSRTGINEEHWWELTRPRSWQTTHEPRLISTYFGTCESFAVDPTGASVVIQGYAWLLKSSEINQISLREGLLYAYLALFSSQRFNDLLAAVSTHVGGGQWNLSKRYVDQLPIPYFFDHSIAPELITDLIKVGQAVSNGTLVDDSERNDLFEASFR